jgi:hypothetical protein
MGRLTEYFGNRSGGGGPSRVERHGDVELAGFVECMESWGHIMTTDPGMAKRFRKAIAALLKEARKNLSSDVRNYLNNDPRKAYRAIKHSVYKSMFGGNISILQKRRAGAKGMLKRQRKLDSNPHQRGGNRRKRIDDGRNRLDQYIGADRGFVLRFINSGTISRQTRYGNRGSIRATEWFGHTAPWQMQTVAEKLAQAITEYVKQETNG